VSAAAAMTRRTLMKPAKSKLRTTRWCCLYLRSRIDGLTHKSNPRSSAPSSAMAGDTTGNSKAIDDSKRGVDWQQHTTWNGSRFALLHAVASWRACWLSILLDSLFSGSRRWMYMTGGY
jgi:hypothetical protein